MGNLPVVTPTQTILHGHEVNYRAAGAGPVVVLIHGVAGNAAYWDPVISLLARTHRVIAPDLLGHGESAKPRGDYSLGAYASGVRDLLAALGHERATIVGHSLGGGIGLQFAYQFGHRCDRLVLVGSGGLGPEVHPALRAAALPGAEWVIPLACNAYARDAVRAVGRAVGRTAARLGVSFPPSPKLRQLAEGYDSLVETAGRSAFVHTLRSVVDVRGQRVDARDRLYLARGLPVLLLWGARDSVIPLEHARAAASVMPGSRLEVFERSGHFPHMEEPQRFAATLLDFLATTAPSQQGEADFRQRLLSGSRPADPAA